jgi:hypothetical protein
MSSSFGTCAILNISLSGLADMVSPQQEKFLTKNSFCYGKFAIFHFNVLTYYHTLKKPFCQTILAICVVNKGFSVVSASELCTQHLRGSSKNLNISKLNIILDCHGSILAKTKIDNFKFFTLIFQLPAVYHIFLG